MKTASPSRIAKVNLELLDTYYAGGYDISVTICINLGLCCVWNIGDVWKGNTYEDLYVCKDLVIDFQDSKVMVSKTRIDGLIDFL